MRSQARVSLQTLKSHRPHGVRRAQACFATSVTAATHYQRLLRKGSSGACISTCSTSVMSTCLADSRLRASQ